MVTYINASIFYSKRTKVTREEGGRMITRGEITYIKTYSTRITEETKNQEVRKSRLRNIS